jgi:hypothetical protein
MTPPLGISVPPRVRTQLIHVSTSGYLWIYTGAEHWINRAVLVVVIVVVYDGKPSLRGRWVNVLFLIFHSQIYCMSAATLRPVIVYGEKPQACTGCRLSSGLCYGDAGNDNLTLSTDISGVAYGGRGNDYFSSTLSAGIWFYGQEGDDTLVGNDEQTNMVGGRGLTPLYAIRRERISLSIIDQSKTAM